MRVFNTPFNSPLNNTDSRIETRTRTEVGDGVIKTNRGGISIDCKDMSKKNIDQYKKWFREFADEMNAYNRETNGEFRNNAFFIFDEDGERLIDEKKSEETGRTIYKRSSVARNFYEFNKNVRKDLCKAAANLRRIRNGIKRGNKEAFYNIERNRLSNNYSLKSVRDFEKLNQELITTITEQRQITDSVKENLPGYLKSWEDNKDGVRSKYKTYEEYVVAAEQYKKDNPGWNKEKEGSTTPWIETNRTTEKRNRT